MATAITKNISHDSFQSGAADPFIRLQRHLQRAPPNNCGRLIGWWGDDEARNEDCKGTGLHARMPAILNTHEFNSCAIGLLVCNLYWWILASVKFWRAKLWRNKDGFAKFAKVLHHQRFPRNGTP